MKAYASAYDQGKFDRTMDVLIALDKCDFVRCCEKGKDCAKELKDKIRRMK